MEKSPTRKINLALQGGGSHGAVTWGVLDRLLEDNRLEIEAISGASAGAVNAATLAFGLHLGGPEAARAKLDELWSAICESGAIYSPVRRTPFEIWTKDLNLDDSFAYQAFDIFTHIFSPYQFNPFNINPLRDILKRCIDFDDLRNCTATKLFLSATNVRTGKVHLFETKDMSVESVLASTCLPFLFKAVEIDGEHYWDGGYMGNPVLYPFIYNAESSDVVIIHVNPLDREDVPVTASEILNRINEISFNSSLLRELRAISFAQKLIDEGWLKDEYRDSLRAIRIHSIRSDKALESLSVASKFSTDWEFLSNLRERGRKIADEWLAKNFDAIGDKSSVDVRAMFESK
ncbi:MAG: alpha/beta hydrolase [Alphaproteobacteria bacterium RIFCSPHIGHO2_12_FULL_63_12]|nr:MAG: alpha/beta hydrolase [Alphaproteobacteria bacterium RIFCSPHIGHO2_12_FULL_63_12]